MAPGNIASVNTAPAANAGFIARSSDSRPGDAEGLTTFGSPVI
jgi:hypothetical protein